MAHEADAATIAAVLGVTNALIELQEFPIRVQGDPDAFLVRRLVDQRQILYLMRWNPHTDQWTAREVMRGEVGQHLVINNAAVDGGTIRLNFVTHTKDEV